MNHEKIPSTTAWGFWLPSSCRFQVVQTLRRVCPLGWKRFMPRSCRVYLRSEMMAFTMAIWPWKIGIQLGKRGIIRVYDGWFDYPFDYLFEATTAVTEGSVSIYSCSPGRPGWILQLICKKRIELAIDLRDITQFDMQFMEISPDYPVESTGHISGECMRMWDIPPAWWWHIVFYSASP